MRIIAFKDNLYNTQDFMKKVASQPFLEGISFNVTTTKDGTIVIFSPISTNESLLDNIQKVTFEEFKNRMFTTLEEPFFFVVFVFNKESKSPIMI